MQSRCDSKCFLVTHASKFGFELAGQFSSCLTVQANRDDQWVKLMGGRIKALLARDSGIVQRDRNFGDTEFQAASGLRHKFTAAPVFRYL